MPRFRCRNCEYVVGSVAPAECPICHMTAFDDLEILESPSHPASIRFRALTQMWMGLALSSVFIACSAAFALIGQSMNAVHFLILSVVGAIGFCCGYFRLRNLNQSE